MAMRFSHRLSAEKPLRLLGNDLKVDDKFSTDILRVELLESRIKLAIRTARALKFTLGQGVIDTKKIKPDYGAFSGA